MNPFDLEKKLNEFNKKYNSINPSTTSLLRLIKFYEELNTSGDDVILEAFIHETTSLLLLQLESYTAYGLPPVITESIITSIERVMKYFRTENELLSIEKALMRIKIQLADLIEVLNGEGIKKKNKFSIGFLVLEKNNSQKTIIGSIESLSITINNNRKTQKNEFNIFPSLPKIDSKLQNQIEDSWHYAINYLKSKYRKKIPFLEINIKFVSNRGIVEGDSLGIALTVALIQELFKFFDLREKFLFSNDIVSTGSSNNEGIVKKVSQTIIEIKAKSAFYSLSKLFVLPFEDYSYAANVISKELSIYPNRNLEIVPIKNISDVINRRDLLSVNKQNLFKWGLRKVATNKIVLTLTAIIVALLSSFFFIYNDNNPHSIGYSQNSYLVKNKFGNILWEKESNIIFSDYSEGYLKSGHRIIDYDDDGINEVLISDDIIHSINLYKSTGELIWKYKFSYEDLKSDKEEFSNTFGNFRIIGIEEENNKKLLYTYISHSPYYPTAIVKIDLKDGTEFDDIFWHAGGITRGQLYDLDKDGKSEILCSAIHNGLGRGVFFVINTDSLNGQSPKVNDYTFEGLEQAKFEHYVLLPTPDYFRYNFSKYYKTAGFSVNPNRNIIQLGMINYNDYTSNGLSVSIRLNLNIEPVEIIVSDMYVSKRDILVREGKLDYPLTDTDEYRSILINQIKYLKTGKFHSYNSMK